MSMADSDTDPEKGDDELPDEVKQRLDPHEQEAYKEAYQTARGEGRTRKESHTVAIEELEKEYGSPSKDKYEFFKGS